MNTVKVTEKIKVSYVVEMSNKTKIQIDPDELPKVIQALKEKSLVRVKRGIFNPAFFVDIIKDEERQCEIERLARDEIAPLLDIFKDTVLTLPSGVKKIQNPNDN
uniref:Uncharacterized protein n=1 Tax=viral metagenome TaxID=1070528 RepID=A0A6M3XYL5_9ZZZZ